MTVWSALYPYPDAEGGGLVFTFFAAIVVIGALLASQELMLWLRAERAMWVARGLSRRETTRRRRQVEEVATQLSDASPSLAPAARAMLESTVETTEVVRLLRPASELFSAAALRRAGGAVFVPLAVLQAGPALLVLLGLLGSCVVAVGALQVPEATLEAALGTGLRAAAWGLLAGGGLLSLSRISLGRAESAVGAIIHWADQQLGIGSGSSRGGGGVDRVLRATAQQSSQTLAALLEQQRTAQASQQQALTALAEAIAAQPVAAPVTVPALAPPVAPAPAPAPAPSMEAMVERMSVTATLDERILEALVERLAQSVSDAVASNMRDILPEPAPAPAREVPRGLFDEPAPRSEEPLGLFDVPERTSAPDLFGDPAPAPAPAPAAAIDPEWLDALADRMVEGVSAAVAQSAAAPARSSDSGSDELRAATAELVEQMRAVNGELQRTARRMGEASAPVASAAASFLTASERLKGLVPNISAASGAYDQARGALDQSATVLREGMAGYADATHTVQEMVRDLRESHRAYRSHQEGWDSSIGEVRKLVKDLGAVSLEIRQGASQLNAVVQPAASAADTFRAASEQLGEVLPGIQGAAESYAAARGALDQSSEALRLGTDTYQQAGEQVRAMVEGLHATQVEQQRAAEAWSQELRTVAGVVADLRVASEGLRASAETAAETARSAASGSQAALKSSASAASAAISASAERAAELMEAAVGRTTSALEGTVTKMAATMSAAADETSAVMVRSAEGAREVVVPAVDAARAFQGASERLQAVLPRMEAAAQAYITSRQALEEASITIQQSSAGYREAGEVVRGMLGELQGSHTQAVARIRDGVDEALLGSMRAAGEQLSTFNAHQRENVTLWDGATERLQAVLGSLRETADHLSSVAGSVEATTQPTVDAAQAFQRAAASLNEAMPRIEATTRSQGKIQQSLEAASETLETGMKGYQAAVDGAAETLAAGTKGYQEAGAAVERMVSALEAQHAAALQQASGSLEAAFGAPMREASAQLSAITQQQADALGVWQQTVAELQGSLGALKENTASTADLVGRFKDAADPAASAADAFREAARRLNTLFPRLEESADGYARINQALASAAGELTASSGQYQKAGEQMGVLTRELQKTLKFQVLGTQKFAESMDRAAGFVQAIGPASERVERAADGLRSASDRTAEVVQSIQSSVSVQDEAMTHMRTTAEMVLQAMQRQSSHWGNFLGELDRLQGTLNSSVDALTTKLPHSIDHTLVHFDAALAEGVARLGGAVERLREAMDDLQERLEMVMADGGRRR